jgi:hypothetical protein
MWWVYLSMSAILVLLPNLLMAMRFLHNPADISPHSNPGAWLAPLRQMEPRDFASWCAVDLALGVSLLMLCRLLEPLRRIGQLVQGVLGTIAQDAPRHAVSLLNIRLVAGDVARFASLAQEYYRKHQEVSAALEESRAMLAQFALQQQTFLLSTNREIVTQY